MAASVIGSPNDTSRPEKREGEATARNCDRVCQIAPPAMPGGMPLEKPQPLDCEHQMATARQHLPCKRPESCQSEESHTVKPPQRECANTLRLTRAIRAGFSPNSALLGISRGNSHSARLCACAKSVDSADIGTTDDGANEHRLDNRNVPNSSMWAARRMPYFA